jgi:hypothetical protein
VLIGVACGAEFGRPASQNCFFLNIVIVVCCVIIAVVVIVVVVNMLITIIIVIIFNIIVIHLDIIAITLIAYNWTEIYKVWRRNRRSSTFNNVD